MDPEKSSMGEISVEDVLQAAHRVLVSGVDPPLEPRLVAHQPLEGLGLQVEQIGHPERLADLREGDAGWRPREIQVVGGGREGLGGVRRCQDASFRNCALIWRAPGDSRYRLPTRPGREVRSGRATHEAWPVHAVCCQGTAISPAPSATGARSRR